MKRALFLLPVSLLGLSSQGSAQTFGKNGQLLVAGEMRNTAAAQVAVAQANLFGSMLLSYHVDPRTDGPARLTIATRYERRLVEVDPRDYRVKLLRKEVTKNALPGGALICRSYAPIDAIVRVARSQHPGRPIEVFPPHRPGAAWRAQIAAKTYAVNFDKKGRATFGALRSRG